MSRPLVMGIVNVTPDSFSDGGRWSSVEAAADHALRLAEQGADVLDIGGESTRPGAEPVEKAEEIERTAPVIERVRARWDGRISIDTMKPGVARAAVAAGAGMWNDVSALSHAPDSALTAAALGCEVVLMHMKGEPRTMQDDPRYDDITAEVASFLGERMAACAAAGILAERIVLDPGFGFAKTLNHNLVLFKHMEKLHRLGRPLLVGVSRKSMIGGVLGRPVGERLYGSLALAALAMTKGASILRVHDVAETVDVVRMIAAVEAAQ